jgi:DMSO/TMAO reductase YedYZ molybdopterin-dependent catalytic subunit
MREIDDDDSGPFARQAREAVQARRRQFMLLAGGATVAALGASYVLLPNEATRAARLLVRPDGRPKLPPGQRVLRALKPMGGVEGDPAKSKWRMRIHGMVANPFTLRFEQLLEMEQTEQVLDVHCVTGWSALDFPWTGVRIADLARRAGVERNARFVIVEGAHGYTANVPIKYAMAPEAMVAHRHRGTPLRQANGAPARAVIPDLYFWKSTKWITGLRFTDRDIPGYWEIRGYHNRGDPWAEERYG